MLKKVFDLWSHHALEPVHLSCLNCVCCCAWGSGVSNESLDYAPVHPDYFSILFRWCDKKLYGIPGPLNSDDKTPLFRNKVFYLFRSKVPQPEQPVSPVYCFCTFAMVQRLMLYVNCGTTCNYTFSLLSYSKRHKYACRYS